MLNFNIKMLKMRKANFFNKKILQISSFKNMYSLFLSLETTFGTHKFTSRERGKV